MLHFLCKFGNKSKENTEVQETLKELYRILGLEGP